MVIRVNERIDSLNPGYRIQHGTRGGKHLVSRDILENIQLISY